jgi:hypothetical protein
MRCRGVVFALLLALAGCGGSTIVTTTVTTPETASTQTTSKQPYERYSTPDFSIDRPAGWTTEEDQSPQGAYLESKWRDPADAKSAVLIDWQRSSGSSPEANATSVRAQTSTTPGYQEISFEAASIAAMDGWKWVFDVPGSRRVDYFIDTCGRSFAILGSTAPQQFDQLANTFAHIADSLQANCSPPSTTTTATISTSTTTQPPSSCPTEAGVTRENDCPPADPANPPADFCATHQCIENFDNGRGTAVQCNDGEWSMSGGIQGACSDHGGESSNPPGPPPNY